MPTFFCLVILFLIWFTYERKKNDTDLSRSKAFWERESKAVYVPRQSMDDLKLIDLSEDIIPKALAASSEELKDAVSELHDLSGKKICDLSQYSNTDLRLKYGTGNFAELSAADNNYTRLVQWSGKLLSYLDKEDRIADAADFLTFLRDNGIRSHLIDKYL